MDLKNSGREPLNMASNNIIMYISCIFSGICFLLAAVTLQLTVKVSYKIFILVLKVLFKHFTFAVKSHSNLEKCVLLSFFG